MKNWWKRKLLMLKMVRTYLGSEGGIKRAEIIRRSGLFHHFGEKCYWHPLSIPADLAMVSIGDNVTVCADVDFITHDLCHRLFNGSSRFESTDNRYYFGKIEVEHDVVIGAHSKILYDVKIGHDSLIAAGSVVTKDVPPGSIVGGVPARVIGSIDNLYKKRREAQLGGRPQNNNDITQINEYFWK